MKKTLVKVVLALVVVAGAGFLFYRSVRQSTAEPYYVQPAHLNGWTLAFGDPTDRTDPAAPMLMLQGPPAFADGLSRQIFKRVMESLSTPAHSVLPLVLRGEFDRSLAGRLTPEQILEAARQAGLGAAGPVTPRCLGYRRTSDPRLTRQVYFALLDMPAFAQFRRNLAAMSGNVTFEPTLLSPVVLVAMAQSSIEHWRPLSADPARDCLAPLVVSSALAP
jgi:hypothetical protein